MKLKTLIATLSALLISPIEAQSCDHAGFSSQSEILLGQQANERQASSIEEAIDKFFHIAEIEVAQNALRYIEVTINNKTRHMIVDSGADSLLLNKIIADEDKIPLEKDGHAHGASQSTSKEVYLGKLDQCRVGSKFDLGTPSVHFLDLRNFSKIVPVKGDNLDNAGQLGLGFFNAIPSAIDYPNNQILVQKQPIQGGIASINKQLGDAFVEMIEDERRRHYAPLIINGKKAYFLVDTGAGANVIYGTSVARQFGLPVTKTKTRSTSLNVKNGRLQMATLKKLKIGTLDLEGKIEFAVIKDLEKIDEINGTPVIGIIGGTLFDQLKATIDFASNTITMAITRKK